MSATVGSMVQACAANRDIAKQQLQRVEQEMERAMPGEVTSEMRCLRARYRAEVEHWADYVLWYSQRVAKEGLCAEVDLGGFGRRTPASARPIAPDPRLPREREPGEDDVAF